jgi:thiol:disulfide interchange protein DsbC
MKKLLLLLTLFFFSIQGFAAGCPDGSEPVKSLSADGTYFVFECNKSSSESTTESNRESNIFDSIDENDKIVFKAENEQYIVHVFTDADCPYCAKFHSNMQRMNALGITVKYLAYPLEGIHPGVQSKMEKIWCAEDKAIAMHNYKTNRNLPNSPDCVNPVAEQLAIGKKLEIWGTPRIFFEDVSLEAGYWYPEELLEELSTGLPLSLAASQSEEYPTVSIEESYEDILLNSARIDAKQKISGFTFTQANYHKMVKKDGVLVKSAPETEITGWYQFIPKENDWHTGIIFFEKGQLKWKNEAGVEWNLQPDINNNKLITGEDNPYQTKYEPDFMLIKSSEKSKSVSQSEEYPIVDYNTNLLEICKRDVEGNWKNDIKDAPYMFAVAGEDGRCEYGAGDTEYGAFNECTKWQEENNIVGTCELYGESGEVVWDGHLKPSK